MIGLIDHISGNTFSIDGSLIHDVYIRRDGQWRLRPPRFDEEVAEFLDNIAGDFAILSPRCVWHRPQLTFTDDADAVAFKLRFC